MKHIVLMFATSCALAACGGGSDEAKDAAKPAAQQLAAAKTCEAGLTLSGDTCVQQPQSVMRPTPSQPLETQ